MFDLFSVLNILSLILVDSKLNVKVYLDSFSGSSLFVQLQWIACMNMWNKPDHMQLFSNQSSDSIIFVKFCVMVEDQKKQGGKNVTILPLSLTI